jgi:transposase
MNQLNVSLQHSIPTLAAQGWSARKIARELGIDRETAGRYLRLRVAGPVSKPAIPPTGSLEAEESKPAIVPAGSVAGRTSQCAPLTAVVEQGLLAGLSAQRIHQDLVAAHGFGGSYQAVKRFVRRLRGRTQLPFRRMEVAPGQEMQVDFGRGAWVLQEDGKRRRPHLFRAVLSHSRKAYSEVVYRQNTESFIRCLENAFRHFGGVTSTVVPDNLKAGVIQADWFDPELNPKTEEFARHYGTVILPTRPATPRHKGKIEAGVKYGQNNALKGRCFGSLAEQNAFLAHWEKSVADTRIHGTTRRQVAQHFETVERPALAPLPAAVPGLRGSAAHVAPGRLCEFKRYTTGAPSMSGARVGARSRFCALQHRREPIALRALTERASSPPMRRTSTAARNAVERSAEHYGPLPSHRRAGLGRAMHQNRGPGPRVADSAGEASGRSWKAAAALSSRRLAPARSQAPRNCPNVVQRSRYHFIRPRLTASSAQPNLSPSAIP